MSVSTTNVDGSKMFTKSGDDGMITTTFEVTMVDTACNVAFDTNSDNRSVAGAVIEDAFIDSGR